MGEGRLKAEWGEMNVKQVLRGKKAYKGCSRWMDTAREVEMSVLASLEE